MKVLIGTEDIAGWIQNYKIGFQKNGHDVTTVVFNHNSLYNNHFDIILNETVLKKLKHAPSKNLLNRFFKHIRNKWILWRYRKFIFELIDKNDLIVFIWRSFLSDFSDLKYAKQKNKKIITLFVGSDVRYFPAFKQQFDVSNWTFPDYLENNNPEGVLKWIRNVEKYSDLIYSVPDQAGLQLRPYYHLQVPMITEKFSCNVKKNKVLKVLHAPSSPHKKGTDVVEMTLNRLKDEGFNFEFTSVRNLPHEKLLILLNTADILVDELVFHGPGGLSFEAMLSGCVVATRYIENSPNCFKPPICIIDAGNIYDKLKNLFIDDDLRKKLAEDALAYAKKNNSVEKVVFDMLNNLNSPKNPDYSPEFLYRHFKTISSNEVEIINSWTMKVSHCDWYKEVIPNINRSGLNF